ncbi:hypothetical protein DWY01_05340 [Eubacterium sp. AF22-8LB]|uniref:hypothetical protein n=1 Tax=Eubacterium sp. AF22-8LB TaxID=2292232 RepID=UPI000E4BCE96|nr:hypothetical protein [Eubacterium sp. AF22-8LB]RGS30877.1 hypothetical protein DWY01_05340 [Eubacterium sp. AF22-8LB]
MLDEFFNGLASDIGNVFANYFVSLNDVMKLAQAAPNDVIDGFPSQALWSASKDLSNVIGTGVASVIISLFLFFELAAIFNRTDTKGLDGIYWILMAFLKVAVAITIAKNMSIIILMCFQISSEIVKGMQQSSTFNLLEFNSNDISQELIDYFKEKEAGTILGGYIVAQLANCVNHASIVIVKLVCQIRFIEIYVFTAVAPLPFCTFCNNEFKHIGISFIKRLLALALQGVFICIVCVFYVQIVNASIGSALDVSSNPTGAMFTMMGYSILLLIAVFQTGGWSKSLLQVN